MYLSFILGGLAISVVFVGAAFLIRNNDAAFRERAVSAIGTVVGYKRTVRRDERNDEQFTDLDIYEYTTAAGQKVSFEQPISGSRPRRRVGESAPILYDASDPSGARLDDDNLVRMSELFLWLSPIGLVIAGISFAVWRRSEAARSKLEGGARNFEDAPASERAE